MMVVKKKLSSGASPKNNSKFAGLQSKIKPVTSLGLVIAALFYGRAGTGKTTLGATFPGPVLHLDIREKGTDSISDLKNVDTLQLEDWDQFEQVYWFLKSGESKYKSVLIDPVSQLQDFAMIQALEQSGKQEGDMMSKRAWGIVSGLMKTWIINYRDLVDDGINVVFLAHDRASDGEEGEDGELMPSVGPRLMPSISSMLNGAVKIIGNTFIRETHEKAGGGKVKRSVTYCLRVGPHAYYTTKIRQPKGSYCPDILENADYNVLVSLMKGELEAPALQQEPVTKKLLKRK
jgi:phage nucleotide-binding protein